MLYRNIVTKPSQREAYDRRPEECRHLTFAEYTERAPMQPERAVGVLVDGARLPFTGRERRRRDGLGFEYVEREVWAGRSRTWVAVWTEPIDRHSPPRAIAMLRYPPTITDVEGIDSITWRAA